MLIKKREVWCYVAYLHGLRLGLLLGIEAKPDPTNREQMTRCRRVNFDFLSNALDVRVERSGVGEFLTPPEGVETLFARDDLTESVREQIEEVKDVYKRQVSTRSY